MTSYENSNYHYRMLQSISNLSILLPFQKTAVSTALSKQKMLVNLPAGSGKTLIALEVAVQAQCKRVLVVCPAFLKLNWLYELKKWYPNYWEYQQTITSIKDCLAIINRTDIFTVVGYSFFQKKGNAEYLTKQNWDMVVCDESHYLRKWQSRRCKDVVLKIAKPAKRLLFLSATPLVTSAADLHPTFSVMQPGVWGKFSSFREQYCNKIPDFFQPSGFRYEGIKNGEDLKKRSKDFIFTAKKSVILKELPPKQVIDLPVSVGKFKHYDNVAAMLDRILETGEDEEIKTERERIGKAKIKPVLELLETFPTHEPVVIFAWHRSVVIELTEELQDAGQKAYCILGGLSEKIRMDTISRFTKGKFSKLVVSIAAGGLGLNLQRASTAIFAELPYSYAEFEQCSDRVHRIGSLKKVNIYKVIAVGSLDEDINGVIETKRLAASVAGVAT